MMNDEWKEEFEQQQFERLIVERRIARILKQIKEDRLSKPDSLFTPKPFHFPICSKCTVPVITGVTKDPQLELLHKWGMPRADVIAAATVPGNMYGEKEGELFNDFSIELFGIYSDQSARLPDPQRLAERKVGRVTWANCEPGSMPMGAGLSFTLENTITGKSATIYVWRWRVYMDGSSLCLENLWYNIDSITTWVPFVLGIKYDDPEKMVADTIRFAPAFRLCNLIEAKLWQGPGGPNNTKIADRPENELRALGKRYHLELKNLLTNVKKDAKAAIDVLGDNWREHILAKYPVLREHPDLLEKTNPYREPSDSDATDRDLDPWEIAIEIAARETLKGYVNNEVRPNTLLARAIPPDPDKDPT